MLFKNADVRKTKTLWENGVRGTAADVNFNYIISPYESSVQNGTDRPLLTAMQRREDIIKCSGTEIGVRM